MTISPTDPSAAIARSIRSVSAGSPRKSPTSRTSDRAPTRAEGGIGAFEAPCRRSSVASASAKRSITPKVAIGRVSPSRPARSPLRTHRAAKPSAITAARSILVAAARLEPNRIEAERSNQIHTVWADSHSRSRTYACSPRAERRQSTRDDGSPEMNGRNCQKVSPEPAFRRP